MNAAMKRALRLFEAEMDKRDEECRHTELLISAGEDVSAEARGQYEQWVKEGRPKWRDVPEVVARVRAAARKAARNQARGGVQKLGGKRRGRRR